jgi:hypothetical protein
MNDSGVGLLCKKWILHSFSPGEINETSVNSRVPKGAGFVVAWFIL